MNSPTPRPNSLEARDIASLVHGLTNLAEHARRGPLVLESGRGVWITDSSGKEYIEGMGGLWCLSLGYGEPRLVQAATRQMERFAYGHLTNHRSHPAAIELAEALIERAPVPMSHVWFASTGSEAMDCAVRIAWYVWDALGQPQRRKFIAHRRAYHGNTVASASLTGAAYAHEGFGLPLPGFLHVTCPDPFTERREGEDEAAFTARLLADIEALIAAEGPDTIAAFFAEPVMAAGGVVVPPAGYFEGLQAILRRHDILLVADEVVTAFGRIGTLFGSEAAGLAPDMLVCAKALSSAYFPISALMMNARVHDALLAQSERRGIFGLTMTYSGHPVGAAIAREALRIYDERALPARVRTLEPAFLGGLRAALDPSPIVAEVRGRGLLAGVQLAEDPATRRPFPAAARIGPRVAEAAEAHGLLVRAIGDTIALCPPLIISESEIAQLIDRLTAAVSEAAADL